MLDTNLILIGPLAAGKTTVGKLLGDALEMPVLEIDDLRWKYYAEIGYDTEYAEQLRRESGIIARGRYSKPFEIYSVERLLHDYPSGYVLPFGAGNSVYDDPVHTERLQKVLAPYPYVVLLLPSIDESESERILLERFQALVPDCDPEDLKQVAVLNHHFVHNPANARLATHTVYTAGQTAAVTCGDVLKQLGI